MDAEQNITEIENLERIFAEPDTRPLSPTDLSAANGALTPVCFASLLYLNYLD